jgi:hypothetical protein
MGVPASEVGYTSATTGRKDHEVHNGHMVALEKERKKRHIVSTSSHNVLKRKRFQFSLSCVFSPSLERIQAQRQTVYQNKNQISLAI